MKGIKYRNPEEMKDSRIDWYEFIPKEWKMIKGKYVFYNKRVINSGKIKEVISLTLNGVIDRDIYSNDGLQPKDFKGYQEFKKDDLVFKLIDLENINTSRVGIVHKDGLMSPAYIRLTTNRRIVNRFYYYLYYSLYIKKIYNNIGNSGVRSSLNAGDLLDIEIFNLDNLEQQKIANFLDIKTAQFDYIIAKKELLIQKLEEAKKSLISEVVTGKAKIIDGEMVPRQPEEMKDSGVEWLGMIPKDWEVKRVKYLLKESIERSLHGKEEPLSMSQKHGLIRSSDMERIPNQAMSLKGNKKCKAGDLVFNKLKSHLGVFSVSAQEGIVSPDYAVYRPIENSNAKYLEYLFKTPLYINEFNRYSKGVGAGLTRLYTDDLFNIVALYPKMEEQQCMVEFISNQLQNTDSVIQKNDLQIQNLKQAKQSLISEAVTGKIDLRDWKIIEAGEVQ